MQPPVLVGCQLEDLETLRELSIVTFREAFEADNNPEDFKAYLQKAFAPARLRKEMGQPGTRFFFAKQGGQIVGYCKLNTGPAQTEKVDPGGLEIERIYISPGKQGAGLGSQLLQQIQNLAQSEGKKYLWLGVWEHNPRAIRFYKRHGFTIFGKHPYYIGTDRQMDWMMRLDLKPTPRSITN